MMEKYSDFEERRQKWYELVDGPLLDHIRTGNQAAVGEIVQEITAADSVYSN